MSVGRSDGLTVGRSNGANLQLQSNSPTVQLSDSV